MNKTDTTIYSRISRHILRVATHPDLIFFIIVWILAGIYYGDVFHIAQQHSFYSHIPALMEGLWEQPYGMLWIIGRLLIQPFYHPLAGGALLAAMLTTISMLFGYVCRLRGRTEYLKYIPAFAYLYIVFYEGFDIYYQAETGKVMGIPFCIWIILLLQSLFVRSFKRKRKKAALSASEAYGGKVRCIAFMLLLTLCAVMFNEWQRPYVRTTTRMQRLMTDKDWAGMRAVPSEADMGFSTVAAYYAIARMQDTSDIRHVPIDQLPQSAEPVFLHNRSGNPESGRDYFLLDYCIATEQYHMAYELGKAELKRDGASPYLLKQLITVCLAMEQQDEADDFSALLHCLPFE